MSIPRKSILAAVLVLGCGDAVTPTATRVAERPAAVETSTPTLVSCPSDRTLSTSGVLGALGGTLQVGGVTVIVPLGALLGPTTINLTVPASPYLEADISVPGVEHFLFELPITVTMDYSRCGSATKALTGLSVWYIDEQTKEPLERMPTLDVKLTQSVTFTTGHLSGYALAN